ncbi:hypothetical protein D3C87_1575350 [compost metagenome]
MNASQHTSASVLLAVLSELERAMQKFPTWPTDPLHALAVLGEEFGELTKAMLQLTYEPHKTTAADVREEAVQTAAMALRLLASLDSYVFEPSAQHDQRVGDAITAGQLAHFMGRLDATPGAAFSHYEARAVRADLAGGPYEAVAIDKSGRVMPNYRPDAAV